MRANPIVAGLSIALIALLGAGAALIRSRCAPPPPVEPPEDQPPPAPRARRIETPRRPARRANVARRACAPKPGQACVVGRVEFPRDVPEHPPFEELQLTVIGIGADGRADVERNQDGEIAPDGAFRLDLDAGDYDLEVSGAALERAGADGVGDEEGFTGGRDLLRAEANAVLDDVVIAVRRSLSIRGTLRGVQGLPVAGATITFHRSGRPDAVTDAAPSANGGFRLRGLRAGSYDISVDGGDSYRRRKMPGVGAPVDGLSIELSRRPVLLGAIGPGPDGGCPPASLRLDDGARWTADLSLNSLCAFTSDPLPDGDRVRMEGTVGDAPISQVVMIPAAGDPAPVCLLGPCAAQPAALAVAVIDDGSTARDADGEREPTLVGIGHIPSIVIGYLLVANQPDDDSVRMGQLSGGVGMTYIDDLPVGRTLRLWAARDSSQRVEETVVVGPGVNEIVLHLPPP